MGTVDRSLIWKRASAGRPDIWDEPMQVLSALSHDGVLLVRRQTLGIYGLRSSAGEHGPAVATMAVNWLLERALISRVDDHDVFDEQLFLPTAEGRRAVARERP